jgi:hypothetical protein
MGEHPAPRSPLGTISVNRIEEILKVFFHPPPQLERESFIRIVELTIPKVPTLSITKMSSLCQALGTSKKFEKQQITMLYLPTFKSKFSYKKEKYDVREIS